MPASSEKAIALHHNRQRLEFAIKLVNRSCRGRTRLLVGQIPSETNRCQRWRHPAGDMGGKRLRHTIGQPRRYVKRKGQTEGSDGRVSGSLFAIDRPAVFLEFGSLTLALEAPALGASGDFGGDAPTRWPANAPETSGELVQRICLVLPLGTVAIARHEEVAGAGDVRREGVAQSAFLGRVERLSRRQLEAELNLRCDLVHVLTTGAATAHVADLEVRLGNGPIAVDL